MGCTEKARGGGGSRGEPGEWEGGQQSPPTPESWAPRTGSERLLRPAFLTPLAYAEASGEVLCPWIPGPLDVWPDSGKKFTNSHFFL